MRGLKVAVFATVVAAAVVANASAQTPAPPITAGWQDGFVLQTANGDNRLVLGLIAQLDGRFAVDNPTPIVDTFTVRRARPTFSGRVAKYFDFKVSPDFGNGTATLSDAYFDIRFSRRFRLRNGKDKTPVGYELLQSSAYLLFPERALASSLVPNRDLGIQALGDLTPQLSYAGGVFNGVPDGASSATDRDTNNSKDLAGRVTWVPFRSTNAPAVLAGFGVHAGASVGNQTGALPSFHTSAGQTYFSYVTGASAAGTHRRFTPAVFYYLKSFGGFAEYVRSAQVVALAGGSSSEITNSGWNLTGSYVLTGEPASDRGIHPHKPFDPPAGHWGALQVAARYSQLCIDPRAFTSGYASATAARKASAVAVDANWYPVAFIKYYATYERTSFESLPAEVRSASALDVSRPVEHVILFRAQLAF